MSENKKIAKNSILLYIRLLVTTIIGLYSSRIILLELGIDDFGLYAVLGGIVSLMNLMGTTILSTSNRFIAVEVGKKENNNPNEVFNRLLVLHIVLSFLFYVLVETIGIWYVKNYLNILPNKITDALFVLRLSIIATVISTVNMPYQSLITIYEKFNVRVAVEILSSFLNLGAVITLIFYSGNKLQAYALLVLLIQLISSIIYFVYCRLNYFNIVIWKLDIKVNEYKKILNYFSWQIVYVVGTIATKQGSMIILNLFFGTALNAAFAIANKVNEFVFGFVKNLNQAAVPQIIKSFSGGDQKRSLTLIYTLSKFTFFLMLVPGVPILLSIDTVLFLWLGEVPLYTNWFVALFMLHGFVSALESGFDATIDATGQIRKTQLFFTVEFLSTLPLGYILFRFNFPVYTLQLLAIVAEIIFILIQTKILTSLTNFNINDYFTLTILPASSVSILVLPQFLLRLLFNDGIFHLFFMTFSSLILTVCTIYLVGLNKQEKWVFKNLVFSKLSFIGKKSIII